mmetsp:Transcript_65025/g.135549  ORF Transcript_65025/g.135549 Transcript_65025/m.135549 type:complete len:198 (-) Transcript_65025:106-699(-)|eukprot:CAMPEP_0181318254 /NCGR_PEP_ID=MMETSP1101-20121128/16908_1 /TAXON_ID=46948 /ORGANISM="Rhodomonas abbreviata, Strain Caron Lab Isolate" /LENGTH=197 /DNA_ID=CAMNT_0023425711 /DNA_START=242 /DNA_END=835 /DNA_ORIENTATION=-
MPVGAAAAAGYRAAQKRQAAAKIRQQEEMRLMQMMARYDKSNDGHLNKDELGDLLQDVNNGERPTEEEIQWVLQVADRQDGEVSDQLGVADVQVAVNTWRAYRENKEHIDQVFEKYDADKSGKLEFEDLKKMLTDLNDGVPPADSEVEHVLKKADSKDGQEDGAVNRMEVVYAVAIWYARLDALENQRMQTKCCVVC